MTQPPAPNSAPTPVATAPAGPPPQAPLVSIKDLTVRYGRTEAVHGISFEVPRGAIFGFIGPNGAGKTSTIKVLATLLRPTSGEVRIAGLDVLREPDAVRRRIGYMP